THEADAVAQGRWAARPQLAQMAAVHGQHEVEALEIPVLHRPRDRGHLHTVALAHAPCAGIRAVALVVVVGARGVDRQAVGKALFPGQPPQDGLGQRRAADVPGADEQHAVAGQASAGVSAAPGRAISWSLYWSW